MSILVGSPAAVGFQGVAPVAQIVLPQVMDPIAEVVGFVDFVIFRMDDLRYPSKIDEEHVQTLLNTDKATVDEFIALSTYSKLNYNIHSLVVQARNNGLNVEEHLRAVPEYTEPWIKP